MLRHAITRSPLAVAVSSRVFGATRFCAALPDATDLRKQVDGITVEQAKLQQQMSTLLRQTQDLGIQLETLSKAIAPGQNLLRSRSVNSDYLQRCGTVPAADPESAREEAKQWHDRLLQFRPVIDEVAWMPTHVSQIGNVPLFQLSVHGSHSAQKEQLIREIMRVEGVTWEDAHGKLIEMDLDNEKYYWRQTLPYRIGILTAVLGGTLGTLMVFCKPVAELYGTCIAGEALPEGVEDISSMTTNQVGTWTWSWMEPMIGVASFVILCSQFARGQMWKLNMRPYTENMLRGRANRLAGMHPQYDNGVVRAWAKHLPMANSFSAPSYRRNLGWKAL